MSVRVALAEAWLLEDDLTQAATALGRTPDSIRDPISDARLSTLWRLHRRVVFQIERAARQHTDLPSALQEGKVLTAVYRVGLFRAATGTPHGYALRLLIEPSAQISAEQTGRPLATLH